MTHASESVFLRRKICHNSSILFHWRGVAITEFFMSTFVYVLHEIQLFYNFTPCISVDVAFLTRHFAFVLKARISPYLFNWYFFHLNWKRLLFRHFSKSSAYFQIKPESEFSSHMESFLYVLFLYYSTFNCPQLFY